MTKTDHAPDSDLDRLRQEYAENELDHDRNPTEDGFVEWLAQAVIRARGEGRLPMIGERPDDADPGVCIGGGLPPQPGDVDLPVLKDPPSAGDLRARLRADRPKSYAETRHITKEYALAEVRRYRDLYPNVAPEVAAFGLVRLVDQWDELRAIQIALDVVLKEAEGE